MKLLSLAKTIEQSLSSRFGRWILEVSKTGDQAAEHIEALQSDVVELQTAITVPDAAFLTQATWYVDAVSGSDSNDGATEAEALKSLPELTRRLNGRVIDPVLTNFDVYLSGTFTGQALQADYTVPGSTVVQFHGATTQLAVGTVTGFTAMNPAGAVRAVLTDATQDFSGYINKRIRLTSGANVGAIAWICSLGGANTIANVSEFLAAPSSANGWNPSTKIPSAGDNYVIEELSTSCATHALVTKSNTTISPSGGETFVRDISFRSTAFTYSSSRGTLFGLVFHGCEVWHNSANAFVHGGQFQLQACAFHGGGERFFSAQNSYMYLIACAIFGRFGVVNGSTVFGQKNIHDGNGTRCVTLLIDGNSVVVDYNYRGFFGATNSSVLTSLVDVLDASQWVLENTSARFWGSAGNTATNALRVCNGCSVQYVTKPTATGATPGDDVVLAGAAPLAWAAIPAIAASPDTAYVNERR